MLRCSTHMEAVSNHPDRHQLPNGTVARLRDLVPADAALYPAFDAALTNDDRRLRFLGGVARISEAQIDRLTHYDPGRAAAIVAVDEATGAMLGVSRLHKTDAQEGEFAVLVRSDLAGQGLGHALMAGVMDRAASLGIVTIVGLVLTENRRMLGFCRDLGFRIERVPGEPEMVIARYTWPSPALAA